MQRFNSKLVRLKGTLSSQFGLQELCEFQFQIGAIKSSENLLVDYNNKKFQFQIGAIKSLNFRFHCIILFLCFNSKLVRLKVNKAAELRHAGHVSIPNWCD